MRYPVSLTEAEGKVGKSPKCMGDNSHVLKGRQTRRLQRTRNHLRIGGEEEQTNVRLTMLIRVIDRRPRPFIGR